MTISRVIEVSFRGSSVALVRIDTAYFYNNGIIFKPTDIDLPTSYQVHWADSPQASSTLETIGTAEGAPIPDDLWNRSRVIYGWIYLHPTEDSSVTGYEVRIYKNVRAGLPDGTEPTPAEQSTIDQAISALNTAVAKTAQDVISADQSARSASGDADRAERARTGAETAQGKAEDAQESAERAKDDAETSERNASESEQKAKGYAETASEKADSIHSMTASAQTLPAGSSASASYNAETGVMSFGIPKGKDGTDGEDGYSPTADVSKTGKVATITITDKNGTTSAQVEDGDDGVSPTVSVSSIEGGHAVSITDAQGTQTFDVMDGSDYVLTAEDKSDIADIVKPQVEDDILKAFPTDIASGAIASFSDGADDLPLKSLIVDINPVQDLSHGDPSPENLCPISGWAEINAYNDPLYGGNIEWNQLCDNDFVNNYQKTGGASITKSEDSYTITYGTSNALVYLSAAYRRLHATSGQKMLVIVKNYNTTNKGTSTVRFSFETSLTAGNTIDETLPVSGAAIYTARSNVYGFGLYAIQNQDGNKISFDAISVFNLTQMFGEGNEPSTVDEFKALFPNDYYPYNEGEKTTVSAVNEKPYTHVNIQLGQTVYGGKLDVLSGELVIDRAMVDLGTLSWNYRDTNTVFFADVPDRKTQANNAMSNVLCTLYKTDLVHGISATLPDMSVCGRTSSTNIMIADSRYTDTTSFKAMLTDNNAQLVYELAEPIEIQLTPNQINSLLGINNIWADSGDTTCVYRADTKLFIERLTAPDSADMIADANITSGQYFMVGNSLYKATANIANGSAIIVGTNAVRKSLSEALNEINA